MTAPAAPPLHWTIDHGLSNPPSVRFPERVSQTLESALARPASGRDADRRRLSYQVLPNFWNGFLGAEAAEDEAYSYGELSVMRHRMDDGYAYTIDYWNATSGEQLNLFYQTDAEALRGLRHEWRLTSSYAQDGDHFRGSQTTGSIQGRDVMLRVSNRVAISAARIPGNGGVTCNWTLFDCFGECVEQAIEPVQVLEDLSKLKANCRIIPLDQMTLSLGGGSTTLTGYSLVGPGDVPSYWWLDRDGRVVMMTTTFMTFVLAREVHSR